MERSKPHYDLCVFHSLTAAITVADFASANQTNPLASSAANNITLTSVAFSSAINYAITA